LIKSFADSVFVDIIFTNYFYIVFLV